MPPSRRPLRFLLVGGWNTAFGYLSFVGCVAVTRLLGVSYLYATVPAQIVAILNAYACHRYITFPDSEGGLGAFLRFNVVYWVLFAVNVPLLAALVSGLGLLPEVAQAILTVVTVVTSYAAHQRFSFRVGGS